MGVMHLARVWSCVGRNLLIRKHATDETWRLVLPKLDVVDVASMATTGKIFKATLLPQMQNSH